MKARVLPLDSDAHRRAELLLPWYANGTLDAAERADVEAHLAGCPRCQADAAFQSRLRAADVADAGAGAGDAARGWAALRDRIDAKPAPAARAPVRAARWPGWTLALGLQAGVLLGVAVGWTGATLQREPYRALGAGASAPAANAIVVFRRDATEAQILASLRAGDARVVGGPTATDAYLLQLAAPGAAALDRLRAQPAVLRAESLVGEAPR